MDAEIINKFDDWFLDADKLSIAGRVLQILDIVLMPGEKDEKLFEMTLEFFGKPSANEQNAVKFLRNFFALEGYGEALPPEHEKAIISLWPGLKN